VHYQRELEWNEPPSLSERRYARWAVVRAAGAAAPSWWPLARIGAVDLYLAPPGRARDASALSVTPLCARKRGRRGSGDYPGVDGHAQTGAFEVDGSMIESGPSKGPEPPAMARAEQSSAAPHAIDAPPPARPYPPPPPVTTTGRAVRVAVVDISFDRLAALPSPADGPFPVGLPNSDDVRVSTTSWGPGHGIAMAGIVQTQCPGAHLGLFQVPAIAGAARPYLAAADLAAAVAAAAGGWQADVVLIAMSDGAWGTPPYLRDVLREAARCGRRGRGAAIFCSVGDPSRNHARDDDSVALGADDLASQPWVQAIAACGAGGQWYRVYPGYICAGNPGRVPGPSREGLGQAEPGLAHANAGGAAPANGNGGGPPGATYNRLGPAVALAASGEPTRWSEHIAADDSSQASALAAAAAASVLAENRDLSVAELRALLALTADAPAIVDGGRGLAAGAFDTRDRLGHNFKTGHGPVNVGAACLAAADPVCLALLATRPVPDPPGESRALTLARAWRDEASRAAGRGAAPARAYARVAGRLCRLFLTSLPVQEALCWLARHVRALAESASPSLWQAQHHGALLERICHALDTARDALGGGDPDVLPLQALASAVAGAGAGAALASVLARLFGPDVMASDGGPRESGPIALASDAVGDRRRRRGPRRADGGGEPERASFAGPTVPGPVH